MEQTDEGQEMEITPLLTSVENRGAPGRFVGKIFLGFGGRIEARKKASSYICTESVVPGTCFWKNIFGVREGIPGWEHLPRAAGWRAGKPP